MTILHHMTLKIKLALSFKSIIGIKGISSRHKETFNLSPENISALKIHHFCSSTANAESHFTKRKICKGRRLLIKKC